MQKLFYLVLVCLFPYAVQLQSQPIPNAGFELWRDVILSAEPEDWHSSNVLVLTQKAENPPVLRVQGRDAGFALEMTNVNTENDVVIGAIANTPFSNLSSGQGGSPIQGKPTSLSGVWRYDIVEGGEALIGVILKRDGQIIGGVQERFDGRQAEWTEFSFPIVYQVDLVPDSVLIVVAAGDFDNPKAGSSVAIDDLRLIDIPVQLANNSFEDWLLHSFEEPFDWNSTNILADLPGERSVERSSDAHSGDFALKIRSIENRFDGDILGLAFSGPLPFGEDDEDDELPPGFPITSRPELLTGYYKYEPVGPDTAFVGVQFTRYNSTSDATEYLSDIILRPLPAAAEWTSFELSIDLPEGVMPDSATIAIASSNSIDEEADAHRGLGSCLWVDDLAFALKTSVDDQADSPAPFVLPNPALEHVSIRHEFLFAKELRFAIYDVMGSLVHRDVLSDQGAGELSVNLGEFAIGMYRFIIEAEGRRTAGTFSVLR